MHETHLIKPIIQGISQHARQENAQRVTRIHLKVGQLLGVKEDSFTETFRLLSKGTILEGAELDFTFFPGTIIQVLSFDVE